MEWPSDNVAVTWMRRGAHWYVSGPYSIYVTYFPTVRVRLYRCWEQVGPMLDSLPKAQHAARMDWYRRDSSATAVR